MVHILYIENTINYFIIKNVLEVNIYHLNTWKEFRTTGLVWTNKWLVNLSIVAFWFHPQMHCHTVHFSNYYIFLGNKGFCSAAGQSKKIKTVVVLSINPASEYTPTRADYIDYRFCYVLFVWWQKHKLTCLRGLSICLSGAHTQPKSAL